MNQDSEVRSGFGQSDNTEAEYDNEVGIELLPNRLAKISSVLDELKGSYVVYIVGMGAQHKSVFKKIERMNGAHVLFYRCVLPRAVKFLSPIIASYGGLIRIDNISVLVPVFNLLTNRGMAGIYLCSRESSAKFESSVNAHKEGESYDFGIKTDIGYFFYVVDADNAESSTGIFEIVSYGRNAPDQLKF